MFTFSRENFWIETLGWLGITAILLAYGLLVIGVLEAHGVWYPVINGFGSLGVLILSWYKRAFQPFVLNLVWLGISVYSIAVWTAGVF